ncbi:hypothetical protein K474DRAFT_1647578 [Panus rudis PR-1116 ss-1]|nr:hypothetical protein K474DRAFT_1647578 [Panus rudis PR-1116 ss-1]
MPEGDVISAIHHMMHRHIMQYHRKHKQPMQAHLVLYPRAFTIGTKEKSYVTCTAKRQGYNEALEPCPEDFTVNKWDMQKAEGDERRWKKRKDKAKYEGRSYAYLLKPLSSGELIVNARGKELFIACGYHGVRIHLGLEATILPLPRDVYDQIVATDIPGPNDDKKKAEQMRSFPIPSEFYVPNSQDSNDRSINIFAAFVSEENAFVVVDFARLVRLHVISLARQWLPDDVHTNSPMWTLLWDDAHGPDWVSERDSAIDRLTQWRSEVLERYKEKGPSVGAAGLVHILCNRQDVFNGFGQHLANDLLYKLAWWPGIPAWVVCQSDSLFAALQQELVTMAAEFRTKKYYKLVCGSVNDANPLVFHDISHIRYVGQYVLVYRKAVVHVPVDLYREYLYAGLLDENHTIGEPYDVPEDSEELKSLENCTKWTRAEVRQFAHGSHKFYSIIKAKRPADWTWQGVLTGQAGDEIDIRSPSRCYQTTLGISQFRTQVQNRVDIRKELAMTEVSRGGRPKINRTGKQGRPSISMPQAKRQRMDKGLQRDLAVLQHQQQNTASG